jgi:hypothetical protein
LQVYYTYCNFVLDIKKSKYDNDQTRCRLNLWNSEFYTHSDEFRVLLPLSGLRHLIVFVIVMPVHSNFVDENVMRGVALYRKQIGQDWRYIRVGKLLVYRLYCNKKYNHSALWFCVFIYITEWPWPNFLYATPLEFRRCAKHAIKITNGEKKLTLLNEIYWRKITYLYVELSTKISVIYLYFSTLFNNFWILIFFQVTKSQQYGCFESCQFRPRSVFFVSWRLNFSADDFRCLRYYCDNVSMS